MTNSDASGPAEPADETAPDIDAEVGSGSFRPASLVGGATMASRVLGLVREQAIAYMFGAGPVTDAFVAAFRIPNLLRDLFAEGAFSAAFVPAFTRTLHERGGAAAHELLNRVLTVGVPVIAAICVAGMLLAPEIVTLLAAGFEDTPGKLEMTVLLTRWMFPFLLLVFLAAAWAGSLNSHGRFGVPAISPAGFNIGMILGALWFARWTNPPVLGLGLGVLVGGLLQWAFQMPSLRGEGFRLRFLSGWRDERVGQIVRLMLPAAIGIGAVQINIFAITRNASWLGDGPVSYLSFAYRLIFLPLGVFAVALATVALPLISRRAAAGDRDGAIDGFREGFKIAAYLVVPTACAFIFFGEPICRIIFERGQFDHSATLSTARALAYYALGLPAFALVRVTAPLFYAHQNTRMPTAAAVTAVGANLVLMQVLVGPMGYAGLALSLAVSGWIQIGVLLLLARVRFGPLGLPSLAIYVPAVTLPAIVAYGGLRLLTESFWSMPSGFWGTMLWCAVVILGATVLHLQLAWLAGIREGIRLLRRKTQ